MFYYQILTLFTLSWNLKSMKIPSLFLINYLSLSLHHNLHVCACIGFLKKWLCLFLRKGQNVKHWVILSSAWIAYLVDTDYLSYYVINQLLNGPTPRVQDHRKVPPLFSDFKIFFFSKNVLFPCKIFGF